MGWSPAAITDRRSCKGYSLERADAFGWTARHAADHAAVQGDDTVFRGHLRSRASGSEQAETDDQPTVSHVRILRSPRARFDGR